MVYSNGDMSTNILEIVNGQQLPQFIGKKVSLTGLITNVKPNGLTFDICTTDNVTIKVNMRKPNSDLLEGYVEVHGTAQNNTVICDEIILFTSTESSEFDAASHNTLCQLLHTIPDVWRTEKYDNYND